MKVTENKNKIMGNKKYGEIIINKILGSNVMVKQGSAKMAGNSHHATV